MNIRISRDDVEIGEWLEEEIRTFYLQGRLVATDLYWKEGMPAWAPLNELINPPSLYPEGLMPVNKRRNVTASQIIYRIPDEEKRTMPLPHPASRKESVELIKAPVVQSSQPLSIDVAPAEETAGAPAKTGFFASLFKGKSDYEQRRKKALDLHVMQVNLRGSILLDALTRLDHLKLAPDETIHFHYTIFTPTMPTDAELSELMRPVLLEEYLSSPENKVLRDYKVTVKHDFVYKDNKPITQITIKPGEMK
jgi:hypothetical protein